MNQLDDDLMPTLRQILSERLFTELDDVQPTSRLIADLRVDSLDFVDLQFVLEERFGIQFGRGEFFDATPDWVTKDGYLQPQAIERLTDLMPELVGLAPPVPIKEFFGRLTVETLGRMIRRQLAKSTS
jgi:acyl carrier protein